MDILQLILILVGGLLGAALLFALISKIMVLVAYTRGNKTATENGLTGEQAANMLIDKLGLTGVTVKQLGFFRATLYGNHYNARTKTIYLRKNILQKDTLTSVALAIQKVALAVQHKNGDKAFKVKATLQPAIFLAPVLFVPLSLVGIIVDLVLSSNIGIISVIFVGAALLFYLAAFIFTLINIPVEKKANSMAMEIITKSNIIDESQQESTRKVYRAYLLSYIADFIISLLELIRFILKLIIKNRGKSKR